MSVFSDGTTSLTVNYIDEEIDPQNERNDKRTSGGNTRTIIGGERLSMNIDMRLTPAQYRTLISIYNSNSSNKYYTPEDTTKTFWSELYPDLLFPINVQFSRLKRHWDNRKYWYVKMNIDSVSYL